MKSKCVVHSSGKYQIGSCNFDKMHMKWWASDNLDFLEILGVFYNRIQRFTRHSAMYERIKMYSAQKHSMRSFCVEPHLKFYNYRSNRDLKNQSKFKTPYFLLALSLALFLTRSLCLTWSDQCIERSANIENKKNKKMTWQGIQKMQFSFAA